VHGEIVRQSETIKKSTSSAATTDVTPQVQVQISPSGVAAKVRYPVPFNRIAEVDSSAFRRSCIESFSAALLPERPESVRT
jgi:hypothetical protein